MNDQLNQTQSELEQEVENANSIQEIESIRVNFLGKKGKVTSLMQLLRDAAAEQKRELGMKINALKTKAEQLIAAKHQRIEEKEAEEKLKSAKRYDFSLPMGTAKGSLHPRTIVQQRVEDLFKSMGFVVEDGREIESEFNNFDAVNVPKNHPARDTQDTFWLTTGEVLKTHTSASQNRIIRKYGAPCKAIFPGRCFRNEELDSSHENTFFQLEGVVVDKDVSVANLIYFVKKTLSALFGKNLEVRLRPGFFPFTEPSFEMDVQCPFCGGKGCPTCKGGGWIELCPCGMIHPNVLEMAGVNSKEYSGFAFGLGLDRLVMIMNEIPDIRYLNSGNIKFLKNFKLN